MFSTFIESQILGDINETELCYYNKLINITYPEIVYHEADEVYNVHLLNTINIDPNKDLAYVNFPILDDKFKIKPRFVDLDNSKTIHRSVI